MRLRRLEGEAIRDAILAVSGGLDRRQFGPSVPIYLTADLRGRGRPAAAGRSTATGRRSIYLAVRRNFLSPMMLAFDLPIPATTVGRRNVSNVPAQALILLNDPFVDEQALAWARRALAVDLPPAERIDRLVRGGARPAAGAGGAGGGARVFARAGRGTESARRLADRRAGVGRPGPRAVEFKGVFVRPISA